MEERNPPDHKPFYFHWNDACARHAHKTLRETHVVVGDHAPERIPHATFSPSDKPKWLGCAGERGPLPYEGYW